MWALKSTMDGIQIQGRRNEDRIFLVFYSGTFPVFIRSLLLFPPSPEPPSLLTFLRSFGEKRRNDRSKAKINKSVRSSTKSKRKK